MCSIVEKNDYAAVSVDRYRRFSVYLFIKKLCHITVKSLELVKVSGFIRSAFLQLRANSPPDVLLFWILLFRWACSGQKEWLPECCKGLQPKWHVQEVPLSVHQSLHQPCLYSWSLQQEEVPQGPSAVLWQGKALLLQKKSTRSGDFFIKVEYTAQRACFKGKNDFWRGEVSGIVKITNIIMRTFFIGGGFFSTTALWHWFGH